MPMNARILLAEDGRENQRLIIFLLKKAGASVDVADNGQIALEMLVKAEEEQRQYDLLLTDMQMPVMDGYALTVAVKQLKLKLPIVAITAHALEEDKQKCLDAGCNDYISKPISKTSLLAVCQKWI
jgi:CheY-like chemotaxis protein